MSDIDNLLGALDKYLAGDGSFDEIEHATTPFIMDDEEKLKDDELSEIVYQLDMHDLEELNKQDIKRLRDRLLIYRNRS